MIMVLDTSAAVELLLQRDHSNQIREFLTSSSKVITSDLYKAEITNVFWKYVKGGYITKQEANTYIGLGLHLIDEFYDISDFAIDSLHEALRLKHSTYDMLYLTLAKRSGGALLTMDKKLALLAASENIELPLCLDKE